MLSKYFFLEVAAAGIDRPIDTHIAYFESIDKKDEADANAAAPSEHAAMSVRIGKRDFFCRPLALPRSIQRGGSFEIRVSGGHTTKQSAYFG